MSKSVQVCTACQFVKGQNIGQNHSQLGNNFFAPPVANSSTSWNHLFAFLNLCPTWVQVKYQIPHLSPNWREVTSCNPLHEVDGANNNFNFCPNWAEVNFLFPTSCLEVVLQLQTNLVRSDTKKYKLASRTRWYHFAHFANFPPEQSTQNCLPGQTSLWLLEQYLWYWQHDFLIVTKIWSSILPLLCSKRNTIIPAKDNWFSRYLSV